MRLLSAEDWCHAVALWSVAMLAFAQLANGPGTPRPARGRTSPRRSTGPARAAQAQRRECMPQLQAKMRELKERAAGRTPASRRRPTQALQDERIAALDAQANDLLAKLDELGTVGAGRRARLRQAAGADGGEPRAAGDRQGQDHLHAGQARPDAGGPTGSAGGGQARAQERGDAEPRSAAGSRKAPPPRRPHRSTALPPSSAAARRGRAVDQDDAGMPRECGDRAAAAAARPAARYRRSPLAPPEEEGYTIDEIMAASAGFFGKVSANLGSVIEHALQQQRPSHRLHPGHRRRRRVPRRRALRQGHALPARRAARRQIYWHGPSLGTDVGADGSKTLFLIYRLKAPEQLYAELHRHRRLGLFRRRRRRHARHQRQRHHGADPLRASACGSAPTSATSASRPRRPGTRSDHEARQGFPPNGLTGLPLRTWPTPDEVTRTSRRELLPRAGFERNRQCHPSLVLYAPCDERAVRLMKDHFIDDRPFAAKLDDESLQLDDAKSSTVLRRKTVGRLVVGLQHKLPFCIQRHAMGRRAALETCRRTARGKPRLYSRRPQGARTRCPSPSARAAPKD